jgi:nicotinamidase-related amidase
VTHSALVLARDKAALLLVDLQEEQRQVAHYTVAGFDTVLANAVRLLACARAEGVLIAHSAYRRDFAASPPRPLEPHQPDGRPWFSDTGSPLVALCAEVAPLESETVFFKGDASAFCTGALAPFLQRNGIEWLVVAGVWTEACIAATVRDAITAGLRVLLVKDACGSGTETMHRTGILNLANRLSGGAVCDTASACALLAGEKTEVWVAGRPVPLLYTEENLTALYESL